MELRGRSEAAGRRHFCVVTETYPPEINGVATTLAQLVSGMRARGHRVSLVRPRQRVDPPGPGADAATTLVPGVRLPGYRGLQIGLSAGTTLRAAWTRCRPDAVYVATEGPLGWSALRAGAALGVAVYSGFHTNFHTYAGHYRAGWLRHPVAAYLRWFHNASTGTFVSTEYLRVELSAAGFRNLGVIGRGVDNHRFDPTRRSMVLREAWGASPGDLVVLYVGRLAAEKNVGLAIEAYGAMRRANDRLRFVLVGDGPLGPALRRAHPDFVFAGSRTGDDLAAHYASADVFLFPSETETFGNVTLEAMASGLGVVAYDYAAARMYIDNGVNGLAIRAGDRPGFIAAAVRLARDPDLLPPMRRAARAATRALDWARVVERFERLLAGAARKEENHHDQYVSGDLGTRRRRPGGALDAKSRSRAPHPARAVADSPPATAAVAPGPDVSLLG